MERVKDRFWDVLIVGAGASGIMAAVTAAKRGRSVLLMDRMNRIGKKLLATGNGRCNYTNAHMDAGCYHGDQAFISRILDSFSHRDCVEYFRGIGIWPKQRNGYFYPNSDQALSVLLALERELARLCVCIVTDTTFLSVRKLSRGFLCETTQGPFRGGRVIFATGLFASPKLGSDGSALAAVKKLGHSMAPVLPALCGFYCKGMDFQKVSGVRCDASLTLAADGAPQAGERGELQLCDYGLSGIPVFQLSSAAVRALNQKKNVQIHIDFLPDFGRQELSAEIERRKDMMQPGETAAQLLRGLLHEKLIPAVLSASGIDPRGTRGMTRSWKNRLLDMLCGFPVDVIKGREAEFAQVCAGGVTTDEVNPDTLESLLVPNIHFAGELLDVDGICGGYNLQWAWSTGVVAGRSV